MTVPEARDGAAEQGLRANSLKLWHLCAMGIAYQGLALAIYLNLGFIESNVGPVAPLIFIGVSVALIPTAISFAVMTNRMPSSGSAFSWGTRTISPRFGVWTGWMIASLYVFSACLQPPIFGLFFNSFLEFLGVHATWWTAALAGLAATAFIGYTTMKDVKISAKVTGSLMAAEIVFVAFLSLFIVVKQGAAGHLSATPFNLSANTGGFGGLQLALVFGVLSLSGFDVVAPLAAEAKSPKRFVPMAVVISLLGAGIYMSLVSYGYVEAVPIKTFVNVYSGSGQVTPIYPLAARYIGNFKLLVTLTGMTAVLAAYGSVSVAASRIMYTLARDGHGPAAFRRLHPSYQTPWNAQKLVLAAAAVLPIGLMLWLDRSPLTTYGWIGNLVVFFVLVTYGLVNVFNIVYHLRRRAEMNWLIHFALPLLGLAFEGYVLYYAFFKTLLQSSSFRLGTSVVILCIVWTAAGVGWALSKRGLRPREALAAGSDTAAVDDSPVAPN
jgi:amino acid transporter